MAKNRHVHSFRSRLYSRCASVKIEMERSMLKKEENHVYHLTGDLDFALGDDGGSIRRFMPTCQQESNACWL